MKNPDLVDDEGVREMVKETQALTTSDGGKYFLVLYFDVVRE